MKINTFIAVALSTAIFVSCTDTTYIDTEIENLKNQVAQLQQQCSTFNNSIEILDVAIEALMTRDFVTSVNPVKGADGQVTGYTITFADQPKITIWLPEKQEQIPPAEEVDVPVISVRMWTDGLYYWTCNGEFITDDSGKMVPTGVDGVTPKLKVEEGKWYVSYDAGQSWTYLADVPEEKLNGYIFSDVDLSDPTKVEITLSDGQKITLPTSYESLVSVSVEDQDVVHNPGDVITVRYTSLKNVTVVVDDSDVESSEVAAADSMNGTIRIQTRSGVSLNKQRAFIIFSLAGAADDDWRMLSFDSSMKARITDIK